MIKNEKTYTAENLSAVYGQIQLLKEQQKVCSFRVQVDGDTIVKRTYDLNEFYSFRHALSPETKTVSIRIYGRFFPIEQFDLSFPAGIETCHVAHKHNRELAYENVRLFSEVLDKDIEIFGLRERLARAQMQHPPKKTPQPFGKGSHLVNLGNTVMLVIPKSKLQEALDVFEKQLDESRNMLNEIRAAVESQNS